jgi:hypothetical protein
MLTVTVLAAHPFIPAPITPPERSMLVELRRRVASEISRYRASGLFTSNELTTIEALWVDGASLRAAARREGVTAQAIEGRIERMQHRGPRFYRWWRLKHRRRARR